MQYFAGFVVPLSKFFCFRNVLAKTLYALEVKYICGVN
jgi:hypothetical protein